MRSLKQVYPKGFHFLVNANNYRKTCLDPSENYDLFKDFIEINTNIIIELGIAEQKSRVVYFKN